MVDFTNHILIGLWVAAILNVAMIVSIPCGTDVGIADAQDDLVEPARLKC